MNKLIINNNKYLFILLTLFSFSCGEKHTEANENDKNMDIQEKIRDVHSYAHYESARTKHIHLDLEADFENKILKGVAIHQIENNNANEIIFDVKLLDIDKVTLGKIDKEVMTEFALGDEDEILGQPLKVTITPETEFINIYYKTQPSSEAVQWLSPSQTADKTHPFLFTQGEPILTRSWIPCQDAPINKVTYSANLLVPKDLMAVMSATNPQSKNEEGKYHFEMNTPIPTYLIALAIGNIEFKSVSERTGVYAEPSMLEAAHYEFNDMEKMLEVSEKLYGKYAWERYDVIVLPPSFPFGGMENPRLTFATPTVIAGDKSLTSLIAHELAHSWSGNVVTNSTWDDFWLNEGFTVYFERRIMEELYGKDYVDMMTLLGYQDLQHTLSDINPEYTKLKTDLSEAHPDDAFSDVPYEKGFFLLKAIEDTVGRDKFDQFLKQYFEDHKYSNLTTEEFISYINEKLFSPNNITFNLDEWIYQKGLPSTCKKPHSVRFELVDATFEKFKNQGAIDKNETLNWSTHEFLHFIRNIDSSISKNELVKLDGVFDFTKSQNAEIASEWFVKSIEHDYNVINANLEKFLVKVGRRKFLMPLYTALKENDKLDLAKSIYEKARPNYHYVATSSIDKLLELK